MINRTKEMFNMAVKHTVKFELPKIRLWKKKADEAVEDGIEVNLKEKRINISGATIILSATLVGFGLGYYVGKNRGIKKDSNVFIIK
jgi:hypothetical protein